MKKSEQKFAQRAIHSLQDSRNSLTEAEELKSSRTSTTLANQQVFKKTIYNQYSYECWLFNFLKKVVLLRIGVY
jgi:hypothetical protein